MGRLEIEKVQAYGFIDVIYGNAAEGAFTSGIATTLVRISHKGEVVYIEPYGIDYECDGGHHCDVLTEEEFNHRYSLQEVGLWKELKNDQATDV